MRGFTRGALEQFRSNRPLCCTKKKYMCTLARQFAHSRLRWHTNARMSENLVTFQNKTSWALTSASTLPVEAVGKQFKRILEDIWTMYRNEEPKWTRSPLIWSLTLIFILKWQDRSLERFSTLTFFPVLSLLSEIVQPHHISREVIDGYLFCIEAMCCTPCSITVVRHGCLMAENDVKWRTFIFCSGLLLSLVMSTKSPECIPLLPPSW